ncbi:sialidase family protein [Chitinophaga barathri]|uniref:exo-alpha-sialidase n=1 Tax=Chitinophaga barathri TaxID=1647451 RepID=A0A3N4M8D0_9BACT|nr:sialidase family protein [Chitinophaga barathri]RPD39505.1 sialidase [Chitinophaga barathri]
MQQTFRTITGAMLCCLLPAVLSAQEAAQQKYKVPVLTGKDINPVIRIRVDVKEDHETLQQVDIQLKGAALPRYLQNVRIYAAGADSAVWKGDKPAGKTLFAEAPSPAAEKIVLKGNLPLQRGANYLWVSVSPSAGIPLNARLHIDAAAVRVNGKPLKIAAGNYTHRTGVALRQHNQDNVHTHRIPGLATAKDGTLLAIYDARRESGRDLQGNIDIGLSRSFDKGKTWQPMQTVIDMGAWGGLPEKFNGVSDANILVDKNTGTIYIAGLWMYGVIDTTGKWVEGLTDTSTIWNHQWKTKGSQPGFGEKQTCQFLIVKSTDNGATWSKPVNVTRMGKKEDWWLWAPAPGSGITLKDGTLVFPTQGRDNKGRAFSTISYSKDGGNTWHTGERAAPESTTENMAVELSDGSIMLNMRSGANSRDTGATNGRVIAVTQNLGQTWARHPTSRNALPEPTCMASIIRHDYVKNGQKRSVLLFSNPDFKTARKNMTIKISFDDGKTWPASKKILLDEEKSRGYSCLTSIDNDTIGILYESSQADLVFQAIPLEELL